MLGFFFGPQDPNPSCVKTTEVLTASMTGGYSAAEKRCSRKVAEILDCLESDAEHWQARLESLRQGRLQRRVDSAGAPRHTG
jgi:hypothetical protein